jgi:cation transporter-like permease
MSNADDSNSGAANPTPPPALPPRPRLPPPQQRNGCLTAFMVVAGIILLLPGLCAVLFAGASLSGGSFPSDILSFVVIGLMIGCAGVMLIWLAIRGPRA